MMKTDVTVSDEKKQMLAKKCSQHYGAFYNILISELSILEGKLG